jgi:hypothetical protein
MIRLTLWFSRYILGLTFVFSGVVKGIDPLGSAYKFADYFAAFGMGAFDSLALPLAFILSAAEILIGILLLMNILNRVGVWGAFAFMAVFTPLTLYLAIYNPVTDCGCFGDAIILTNWETFFKNIPLFIISGWLLYYRGKLSSQFPVAHQWLIASILAVASFVPSVHGYLNLPLMDFRPYSIGTNIIDAMSIPENAPTDQYKTTLVYEKDGVAKEFSQDNFPWQDTTWKFVDSKSVLVSKGYRPPIQNFDLTDFYGWNHTDSILNFNGYYLFVVAYRLDKANEKSFAKLNELFFKAKEQGIGFVCLTASPPNEIDRFVSSTGVAFPFLLADEIMLKTIIRANPGIMLTYNSTIIGKWHYRNIPEADFFDGNIYAKALSLQRNNNKMLWIYIITLLIVGFKLLIMPLKTNTEL